MVNYKESEYVHMRCADGLVIARLSRMLNTSCSIMWVFYVLCVCAYVCVSSLGHLGHTASQ